MRFIDFSNQQHHHAVHNQIWIWRWFTIFLGFSVTCLRVKLTMLTIVGAFKQSFRDKICLPETLIHFQNLLILWKVDSQFYRKLVNLVFLLFRFLGLIEKRNHITAWIKTFHKHELYFDCGNFFLIHPFFQRKLFKLTLIYTIYLYNLSQHIRETMNSNLVFFLAILFITAASTI